MRNFFCAKILEEVMQYWINVNVLKYRIAGIFFAFQHSSRNFGVVGVVWEWSCVRRSLTVIIGSYSHVVASHRLRVLSSSACHVCMPLIILYVHVRTRAHMCKAWSRKLNREYKTKPFFSRFAKFSPTKISRYTVSTATLCAIIFGVLTRCLNYLMMIDDCP